MSKKKVPALRVPQKPSVVSPLQLYLQEVARYPLLTPEEEYDLAVKHYEQKDVGAAHCLITSNLRLVVKIANDFRKAQANLLDLIQEGNYGLMKAVKKFNPYRGVKLSSYAAWWIKAYILKYLMDNRSLVKIATTSDQRKLFYNLQKEVDKLIAEHESVDPKVIAKNLNVAEKDVLNMQQRLSSSDLSIDAPVKGADGQEGLSPQDFLQDNTGVSIEALLADQQVQKIFTEHLEEFEKGLVGRDREVFRCRLRSETPVTLQEIGDRFGVSRERARQIEARILRKLKAFVKEKGKLEV